LSNESAAGRFWTENKKRSFFPLAHLGLWPINCLYIIPRSDPTTNLKHDCLTPSN
jgi:hypothetical protein